MISLPNLVRVPPGFLVLALRHCLINAVLLPFMTCVGAELLGSLSPPVRLPDGTEFKTWEGKPSFSRTYYVDGANPRAVDSNPGTAEQPFATINRAAQLLQPGERVIIAPGVYRERIIPARGGNGPDQMISYEAAPGARVILKGSRVFPEKWTLADLNSSGRIWEARLSPSYFGGYNPFDIDNVTPGQFDAMDWAEPLRGKPPCTLPRGLVFQDGRRLAQVTNLAALTGNEGCYYVDRTNQVVFAAFFGPAQPDNLVIEITTQETVFAPEQAGLGYIRVKGLVVEQVAGPFPFEQVGAISTTRGHHWIIEDNTVRQVNGVGIDVGIQLGKSPQPPLTGFHIVRRNTVTDCGICGIAGLGPSGGKEFGLLIEDNVLLRNAFHDVEQLFETAGIKTHRNVRCLIRRNLVMDTLHGPGIWMDWDNRNSRCCQNVVINTHTRHGGIFVEASYVPNLVDQNVVWGTEGDGIYEHDSRDQVFAHNLVGKSTKSGLHLHGKITDRKVGPPPAEYGRHQVRNNLLYENGKADVFGSQPSTLVGNLSKGFAAALDSSSLELTLSFTNAPSGAEPVAHVTSDFFDQPRQGPKTAPGPFAQIAPGPVKLKSVGEAAKRAEGPKLGEAPEPSRSIFTRKPNDPRALLLSDFGAVGDGVVDDSPAIQKAIDALNHERGGQGIIFVPEGRYRLGSTINIWRGIRLIGFGQTRPVFVLGKNTPGFQEGEQKYMIHFRQNYPRPGQPAGDAMNDTFASGIININVKLEPGNPAAIAMRYHVAQLCTLSYIDFDLGDAEVGVEAIGNQIANCRFFGGKFGIRTHQTSAGWQALLMDCVFEGQKVAGVQTDWAGLTVVRCQFGKEPSAIVVPEGKNEHLYLRDCLLDGITNGAVVTDTDQRPQCKINMHNVICRNSPLLVRFRDGKKLSSPEPAYVVKSLSSGLQIENATSTSATRAQETTWERKPLSDGQIPAMPAPDVPPLPPQEEWVNIVELGAKGDNQTDDTAVFQNAIAEHKVIYVPLGRYVINDTLELKPGTVLIGLHPMKTLFVGAAGPEFSQGDAPKPMVITPRGGTNFICGLGWQPSRNPGIIHLKWQSGARSCLDDAFFSWGSGTSGEGAKYGLWVNGGGGTFRNIWTPNNCAANGWYVSNTDVPGRVYLISVEHHSTVETLFENVSNWLVCDLQTEIITSGPRTPGLEMTNCQDVTFVNLFLFRAGTKEPFAYGATLTGCGNLTFLGMHNFNWGSVSYQNSLRDTDSGVLVPEKEIARLTIRPTPGEPHGGRTLR